jgi:hypothetical protein
LSLLRDNLRLSWLTLLTDYAFDAACRLLKQPPVLRHSYSRRVLNDSANLDPDGNPAIGSICWFNADQPDW